MCRKFQLTILLLIPLVFKVMAIPLISDAADDDDDTEVIELPGNGIETSPPPASIIDLSAYGAALFGEPDEENTATLVGNYSATEMEVNPEELGSYLEGDILIPMHGEVIMKNGLTTQSSRWPNAIVPYVIAGNFNSRDRSIIDQAIAEYHRRTCIRFVQRTSERDYVSIVSGSSGCWSSVGRVGGKQEVNLQSPGCLTKPGTTLHELMHALGFLHEQNRMERDGYVAIQYRNIQSSAMNNFEKAARTEAFGVPYDYGSVMHYSANAFSVNGQPTIVAMQSGGGQMGQRDGFSDLDVSKLNKMYNCGATIAPVPMPVPVPAMPSPGVGAGASGAGAGAAAAGSGNAIVDSFLGGLISGLGLGDDDDKTNSTNTSA